MRSFIFILLIIISISLVVLILLQQKGSGLGAAFGGGSGGAYRSQRGVEKIFHYLTIILAFLYAGISLGLIFVR